MDSRQRCPRCDQLLPLVAFIPSYRGTPGKWCRACKRTAEKVSPEAREYRRVYMKAMQRARADLQRTHDAEYRALLAGHLDALRATEDQKPAVVVTLRP